MMNTEQTTSVRSQLMHARRSLRRRRVLELCLHTLGLFAALHLLVNAWNFFAPLKEQGAATLFVLIVAFAFLFFAVNFGLMLLRAPPLNRIAWQVEQAHPELMDALAAGAEAEAKSSSQRTPVENVLLHKISPRLNDFNISGAALPRRLHTGYLTAMAALFCVLAAVAGRTETVQKAVSALPLPGTQNHPGLVVEPGNLDTPKHDNVTVQARIHRWERKAWIVYKEAGSRQRYAMHQNRNGFEFTFYDVRRPLQYRVVTPSLASPWYQVSVYTPPRIKELQYKLDPPAYTDKETHTYDELQQTSAPEGTEITLRVSVPEKTKVYLKSEKHQTPFRSTRTGDLKLQFRLEATRKIALLLKDAQGHTHKTKKVMLKCIPDMEPVIDVVRPGRDTVKQPDENVLLRARAGDDYGVKRVELQYNISGGNKKHQTLYPSAGARPEKDGQADREDIEVKHKLNLKKTGAESGDIIVYTFTAVDNQTEKPQRARSQVYFIEVRPDFEGDQRGKSARSGSGRKRQEIALMKVIGELKRLIRLSYRIVDEEKTEAKKWRDKLAGGLQSTHAMADDQLSKIKKIARAQDASGGLLITRFREAVSRISRAAGFAGAGSVKDAIPLEEKALGTLVSIAQEIMKQQKRAGSKSS